jgi:transposase
MFQTDGSLQPSLFAFSHRDLVKEDSDVWLYIDLFEQLDLLDFDSSYSSQGQISKDPKLMLRTIFFALTHGINSGRKLADVCRNDNRYIVLSGQTFPDRRTFDRFINRHEAAIERLFSMIVRLAQKMGLVTLGRVAIDGTKFRAYAGKQMRYENMSPAIQHINAELKALKKDLKKANAGEATEISDRLSDGIRKREERIALIKRAKIQIEKEFAASKMRPSKQVKRKPKASKKLHDPEALSLGSSSKFPFGYNAQAAVDAKSQIVVAAELSDNANDSRSLPLMLDKVAENCGAYPQKTLADNGYYSLENITETKSRGSVPYISPGGEHREAEVKSIEQITKNSQGAYFCLRQKELVIKSQNEELIVFSLNELDCRGCPFQNSCKMYGLKSCQIPNGKKGAYLKSYLKRSRTPKFEEIYRRRKAIVEPVFGNIKNKGHRLYKRGKKSISTWWKMVCMAHNIEKIVKIGSARDFCTT